MKRSMLVDLAAQQVGTWCYVWGGNGEDMTAMSDLDSWINRRESDEKNRARVRKLFAKLQADGINPIRGGDCSGFVYWCMKTLGLWKTDINANGMMHKTTRIDKTDLEAGDLAFLLNGDRATHVGIYAGGGEYIHSKGRDVGVVREKCSWHSYGRIEEFDDGEDPDDPTSASVRFKGSVNLRQNPTLDSRVLAIAHKGDRLPLLGIGEPQPDFRVWLKVEHPVKGECYCSRTKYTEVIGTDE